MAPGSRAKRVSAGIVLFRRKTGLEVLIAHPGGPFWSRRDEGAWSIPKGLVRPDEDLLTGAVREFEEETGLRLSGDSFTSLGSVTQRSGKTVHAWATEGEADPDELESNSFTMEWPPGSGRIAEFPEMDRFMWATSHSAREKLNKAQIAFVLRLSADTDP